MTGGGIISGADDPPGICGVFSYLSRNRLRSWAAEIGCPAGLAEVLSLNADSRMAASSCGWGSAESLDALQAAMSKAPARVRLFPDAAGSPAAALSASSTAMLATPPGPQPVAPGAEKVVSLVVAF